MTRRPDPIPSDWHTARPLFADPRQTASTPVSIRRWKSLFDGTTLNGWSVDDNKELWVVENGTIHCLGNGGGYLRSLEQFGDFALACEAMVDKGVNSGVFVRWSDVGDPVNTGIEVQVIDSAGKPKPNKHDSGALYDLVAPTVNPMKPAGEWNRYVITCMGPDIRVRLNGVSVAQIDLSHYTRPGKNPDGTGNKFKYAMAALPRRGYIGLQNHGGSVWFRNLRILPL